jgi:hypothetical protein
MEAAMKKPMRTGEWKTLIPPARNLYDSLLDQREPDTGFASGAWSRHAMTSARVKTRLNAKQQLQERHMRRHQEA